jgi:hypothetical protein
MASTAPFNAVCEICDVAAPISATNEATLMTEPLVPHVYQQRLQTWAQWVPLSRAAEGN